MTTREDYDHKFICQQCGETVFAFGHIDPIVTVCAICRLITAWQSGLGDPNQWPDGLRFSRELNAAMAIDGFDGKKVTCVHCIYLDENGRSQSLDRWSQSPFAPEIKQ